MLWRDHVRAGDVIHPVVGHTRWTAATREVVRQWWGRDPGFTLVMLSLSSLGALFFRGELVRKVDHRLLRRHVPQLHPQPLVRRRVRARRRTGGALVVPRVLTAARGRGAGLAGDRDLLDRGFVDGGQRRLRPRARLRSARSDCSRRLCPMSHSCTHSSPTARATSWCTRRCSRACGVRSAARRGVIVTVERIVDDIRPWSHLVRIPAHRVLAVVECPMGAHPGGLFTGDVPGRRLRRGLRLLGRRPCRDASRRRRVRRVDPALGARRRDQEQWLERLGPERITALRAKADPDSLARRRGRVPARPRRAGERVGARRGVGRAPLADAGRARRAPTRCSRAPASRTSPRGSACRSRATRAPTCKLTAEIGMWDYDATLGDPFVLNHRNFPTATMLDRRAVRARRARRRSGHHDDRVPRRRAGRPLRQHQLDVDPAAAVPRRLRGRATTSRAPRPRT